MPRLAVLSILALAALLIGAALASITSGGDPRPADRYPTEQEARGAYRACRAAAAEHADAEDLFECSLWVLDATGFAVGRFPNAAARWVRWDRAGRPDGPLRGDAVGA